MADDARQVANWFVTRARQDGRSLSIMSLLKLTYIAHGWYLESRNEPLFPNHIEAWQYGPVVPEVYRDFRRQGITVQAPVNTVREYDFPPQRRSAAGAGLGDIWSSPSIPPVGHNACA